MKPAMIAVLLVFLLAVSQAQTPPAGKQRSGHRIALVVGNQNYLKLPALGAVSRETELIRTALAGAGFTVISVKNATLDDLDKALRSYTDEVQAGDVCAFYYSGYAVQDGDDDLLLPVDFNPSAAVAGRLHNFAYPVTVLAQNLGQKTSALKMFFLEGARRIAANIPDTRPGLRIPDTTDLREVLFGIPTAASRTIDTPPDQAGIFTEALARTIDRVGLPITSFMSEVLKAVMDKSKDQQQPANGIKLTEEFYFHAPLVIKPVESPRVPQQNHIDREFYTYIPPGTFSMGCVPSDTKCDKDEKPQHKVTLTKGFWMGQNEVQVGSYSKFIAADKEKRRKMPPADPINKKWKVDDYPISGMTWDNAADYCGWAGGRLPTEAEWEYAARAGKENEIYPFDPNDVEKSRGKANFYGKSGDDRYEDIAPVRKFDKNAYLLYDLAGNVWEFVNDFMGPYAESPVVDPKGPADGKLHVRRGGSFDSDPKRHLRISVRVPSKAEINVGFRCVMDDTPETKKLFQDQ